VRFGRKYDGLLQAYKMDDAEVAILSMGSISGLCRMTVDHLRKEGIPVGSLKLRVFRPFPQEELAEKIKNLKLLIVFDRDVSIGMGGIVYSETLSSLFKHSSKPIIVNYIIGLGGRDVTLKDIISSVMKALKETEEGKIEKAVHWSGVRGLE
jgi:pyruvate/2-oxoacid:ferredoxin oxidoreductase alpha subunit